jgi:UDP-N-acetylglucosamine acyltransferase
MIHPTAVVHPKAKVDSTVRVGPHSVIDEGVELGANCVLGPHVYLAGNTVIGSGNKFHSGAVIGDAPQDLKYKGEPTKLRIGNNNVFREHVTVHRSATLDEDTVIGSNCFLMAGCHVAHNCNLGNAIIIANGSLLGGHVHVEDRVLISGNCLIHQFCRLGTLSMMRGGAGISKDLPPFTVALEVNQICGLNVIGLRRAGFNPEQRLEVKQAYHILFRRDLRLESALAEAREKFSSPGAKMLIDFVAASKRGVCPDVSRAGGEADEEDGD